MKDKTIKLLEDNMEECVHSLSVGKYLFKQNKNANKAIHHSCLYNNKLEIIQVFNNHKGLNYE